MVPLGIGLLGLVIGAIALFMSFSNNSKITQLNALSDTVTATAAKADAAKAAADGIASKVDQDGAAIAGLHSAVQDALNKLQDTINQHTTELASLKSSGSRAPTASGSKGTATAAEASNVGPNGGTHVITSGETLGILARKYGVTVKEIQDANPGVDSSKLRIGQKITIPAPRAKASAPAAAGATGPATAVAQ